MQESQQTDFRVIRSRDDTSPSEGADTDSHVFVIEDSLGYLMNYTAKLFARSHASCLEPHATLGQWAVLMFLWANDGLSQTELSRQVAIDDATMVRSIDRMERDGLVQRVRNTHDRRQINIFLTAKGHALRDVLVPCALAVNATAIQGFTDEEQRQLFSFLRRITASLERALAEQHER
jgi:MarR family transcriptional regulator, organic hydroperoxide resistance regulator